MTLSQEFPDLMLPVKVIPLTQGQFAIVDPEDYEELIAMGSWRAVKPRHTWYAFAYERGSGRAHKRDILMHRVLTGSNITDHINRNGLDNRRANLRGVTNAENLRNARLYSRSTSGYRGVSWDTRSGKWRATYYDAQQKVHWIGLFISPEEASHARKSWLEARRIDAPD